MAKYIINGGNKLNGRIRISGNKNEVLPCMAAALLTDQPVTLTNIPNISDVAVLVSLLESLGSKVTLGDHSLTIHTPKITKTELAEELTRKLRASVLLAGPLLARSHNVTIHHPGGDVIGIRSLESHWQGFQALGYQFKKSDQRYDLKRRDAHQGQVEIFMEEASVTAAENLIICCCLQKGTTIIRNTPEEPHVTNLCRMLKQMGAKITGEGTSCITIEGVNTLSGTEFEIGADFIEIGTYAIAAAITGGKVELTNCSLQNLEPIIYPLQKMGINFVTRADHIEVTAKKLKAVSKLHTNIWPGFPTDLMSVMIVLATQSQGVSLLHDWMYESRMFFVDKIISMGANITIADPHRVVVFGPTRLSARNMDSPDIRAGVALVLAALVAKGTSTINHAELIERGYENVVGNLSQLGADINRTD